MSGLCLKLGPPLLTEVEALDARTLKECCALVERLEIQQT